MIYHEIDNLFLEDIDVRNINKILYDSRDFYYKMYSFDSIDYNIIPNRLYKKELFIDIRFPVGKLNEDAFTLYKLIYKCKKIVEINEKLYFYFMREDSIMHSKVGITNFDFLEFPEEQLDFLYDSIYLDVYRRCALFHFINLLKCKNINKINVKNNLKKLFRRKKLGWLKLVLLIYFIFPILIDGIYIFYKKVR